MSPAYSRDNMMATVNLCGSAWQDIWTEILKSISLWSLTATIPRVKPLLPALRSYAHDGEVSLYTSQESSEPFGSLHLTRGCCKPSGIDFGIGVSILGISQDNFSYTIPYANDTMRQLGTGDWVYLGKTVSVRIDPSHLIPDFTPTPAGLTLSWPNPPQIRWLLGWRKRELRELRIDTLGADVVIHPFRRTPRLIWGD